MLHFTKPSPVESHANHRVYLTYHQRVKARQRIVTEAGVSAGVLQERGSLLKDGQKLSDDNGEVLEILAKDELVSVASTSSSLLFSRACYHVGNRHAEVQIEELELIYLQDHVMDQMLCQLGLQVVEARRKFTPENGAYVSAHHHHDHDHDHDHNHNHDHNDRNGLRSHEQSSEPDQLAKTLK